MGEYAEYGFDQQGFEYGFDHSSNSTKNVTHYSQSSCENVTPSSGTSPVAFYWEVTSGHVV